MAVNVKRYIINYSKFVTERIPMEFRFDDVIAYVNVLVSPLVSLYNNLLPFRDQVTYKLNITSQVCFLEKMLNDRYDVVERRIYIRDGNEYLPTFIFRKAELQPLFVYTKGEASKPRVNIYRKGEVGQFTYDFVVCVPASVPYNEREMRALISYYKLASKFFTITTF
ncbi:hypothetical protein [Chryseosolibacter indicus]|uniref:IPExxxVDY family protein n=1 Tax=Chryseosolibacter indicus TaxID=2782351 RepID=A0ABS5VQ98_9BACT|nr:hypothetical protein [Chryseosolibacter indicus]MBT1702967.1 hypothetical protein [Chryseosolibacter indicus]